MSSLIFATAKAIRNRAKKYASNMAMNSELLGNDYKESYTNAYDNQIKIERTEFIEILKIASLLHEDYLTITNKQTNQWYFITIRPDESICTFDEFYKTVVKYLGRKCINTYHITFEQKSTDIENLGKGFHCHIICDASWRSKKECLRDTQSSFNKIAAHNCIDVKTTKEPDTILQNYLIDYKSDDDHKIVTKECDSLWRENMKLSHIYTDNLPSERTPVHKPPIKSVQGAIVINMLD